jgi:hypothetical protein
MRYYFFRRGKHCLAALILCATSAGFPQSSAQSQSSVLTLKRQAEAGDVEAQAKLGMMYLKGSGVEKDLSEGFRWSYKAGLAGSASAAWGLGWAYGTGSGVVKNDSAAFDWTRIAALRGEHHAQTTLAALYLRGLVVNRDLTMAYAWVLVVKNAEQANPPKMLSELIPKIAPMLSDGQRSEAVMLSGAWSKNKDHVMPIHSSWYIDHPEEHQDPKQSGTQLTQPKGCTSGHWLSSKTDDGKFVTLEDDSLWEIDDVDTVDSELWLDTDDIVVCPGKLINTEENESVGAKRVK